MATRYIRCENDARKIVEKYEDNSDKYREATASWLIWAAKMLAGNDFVKRVANPYPLDGTGCVTMANWVKLSPEDVQVFADNGAFKIEHPALGNAYLVYFYTMLPLGLSDEGREKVWELRTRGGNPQVMTIWDGTESESA